MDKIIIGQLSLAGLFCLLLAAYINHLLANTRDKITRRRNQCEREGDVGVNANYLPLPSNSVISRNPDT